MIVCIFNGPHIAPGTAYMIKLSSDGSEVQRIRLSSNNCNHDNNFGKMIAVSGNASVVLVSSPGESGMCESLLGLNLLHISVIYIRRMVYIFMK